MSPKRNSIQRLRAGLHVFAALLLLTLAAVKIAALSSHVAVTNFYSPVFPFLSNKVLYTASIAIEIGVALLCLRHYGEFLSDWCLLSFVGLLTWYRIGASLTEGEISTSCGCLGILTVLFKFSRAQESAVAITALVMLFICGLPGLLLKLREFRFRSTPARVAFLALIALLARTDSEASILELRGEYRYQRHNAETGAPFTNLVNGVKQWGVFDFTALLRGNEWKISVTNQEDSQIWTELAFDGTNFYTLQPYNAVFVGAERAIPGQVYATVDASPHYHTTLSDRAYAYVPWLTFGFNPRLVTPNKAGIISLPLPWQTSRGTPHAYGWEWKIESSPAERFLSKCTIIRNANLDMEQKEELLRWEMVYPEDISQKNGFLRDLEFRKQMPHGFVETKFTAGDWIHTNGFIIPTASELQTFIARYSHAPIQARLSVRFVNVLPDTANIAPTATEARSVTDFRYKRANKSRIYKFAKYSLGPSEEWKPADDAVLLAAAEEHLKSGRRYNWYDYSLRTLSVWLVGLVLVMIPIGLHWIQKKKRNIK